MIPNCRVRPKYTSTRTAQFSSASVGNVKQQPSKSMAALISERYFTTCLKEPQIELYSVYSSGVAGVRVKHASS